MLELTLTHLHYRRKKIGHATKTNICAKLNKLH